MKTVIISGANGYFGGVACQYFKDRGWLVLKATRDPGDDIFFDLDDPENIAKQKINCKVDLFIHAAAAHEVSCREQPYRSVFQNVAGTKAALDFCVANQILNFVYLSTFHVFGNPIGIITEETIPYPSNDYGLSHLQAEQYVQMYTRQKKIRGMVVRPSNFFGVPADLSQCKRWTLVPLLFCRDAIEKQKIVLNTPGYQKRNFIAIEDICRTIETAFSMINEYPLLHIAGIETFSIREFAIMCQIIISEILSQEIEVLVPNQREVNSIFTYSSLYLHKIYQPRQQVKNFIREFTERFLLWKQ